MKRIIALASVFLLLVFNIGFVSGAYAQTDTIEAETVARELAQSAGGTYVEGSAVPELTGNQVSLPIIDEATGDIIGYIVADQDDLVSVLNDAGLTEVANALSAVEAGAAAGEVVEAGLSGGTIAMMAGGVAVAVGIALAVSSGGGDGDSTTTTTSHH